MREGGRGGRGREVMEGGEGVEKRQTKRCHRSVCVCACVRAFVCVSPSVGVEGVEEGKPAQYPQLAVPDYIYIYIYTHTCMYVFGERESLRVCVCARARVCI